MRSGRSWNTSVLTLNRPELPRRVGRRCGMRVMRQWAMWVRVRWRCQIASPSGTQTGIWRHSQHPMIRARRAPELVSSQATVQTRPQGGLTPVADPKPWSGHQFPPIPKTCDYEARGPGFTQVWRAPKRVILRPMWLNFLSVSVIS